MIKTSTRKTIDLPFEAISNSFNLDKHFLLQGIKNHRFLTAEIKKNDTNQIIVSERKGMRISYSKSNNQQTEVECYFEYGIFFIIIALISLLLIFGFITLPIIIGLRYLVTRNNIKKIEKNYLTVFESEIKIIASKQTDLSRNSINPPPFKFTNTETIVKEVDKHQINNFHNAKPNINKKTPPPIPNEQFNPIKNSPPPIPQIKEYYIVFQGSQKGPLEVKTLKEMISLNMIDDNTLIWSEGMSEWEKISKIDF